MERNLSSTHCLERQVQALFETAPGSPVAVGTEVECLTRDGDDSSGRRVVTAERLLAALATDPELASHARFSIEPGGQLESSPAPVSTPRLLDERLRALHARTERLLASNDIDLILEPVDAARTAEEIGLQAPADRYRVMQRHFDAIGPAGRQMMRRTASLQICVALGAGRVGRDQWFLANMAAPALAAAFTWWPSGTAETRLSIWRDVDPSRTGLDGGQVDRRQPSAAYASFALAAEAMPLPRGDGSDDALPFRRPFGKWLAGAGDRPDAADIAHHLSTLFPPVRPRGDYLELRFIDAQPAELNVVPIAVLATLLIDDATRDAALEIVGTDPGMLPVAWRRAAADPQDATLRATAAALFDLVAGRARTDHRLATWLPAGAAERLAQYAERRLTAGQADGRIAGAP